MDEKIKPTDEEGVVITKESHILPKKRNWKKILIISLLGVLLIVMFGRVLIYGALSLLFPDSATPNYTSLSLQTLNIPDADNAYADYLLASSSMPENSSVVSSEVNTEIEDYMGGKTWDAQKVASTVDAYSVSLTHYVDASDRKVFQYPLFKKPEQISSTLPLPSFAPLRKISRMSELRSLMLLKNGEIDKSISEAFVNVRMGSLLEQSPQGNLVTYIVGAFIKDLGLTTLSVIAHDLRTDQVSKSRIVTTVTQYHDDGTGLITAFKVEYAFRKHNVLIDAGRTDTGTPVNNYLFRPNESLGYAVEDANSLITRVSVSCAEFTSTTLKRKLSVDSGTTTNIIKLFITPNGIGKALFDASHATFDSLFQKRCAEEAKISGLGSMAM